MEEIIKFIDPTLLVLVPVLYFIGRAIKKSETVKDQYIPFVNGAIGILLASLWLIATKSVSNYQDIVMLLFVAVVQGCLCAGVATWYHEMKKQAFELRSK